MKRATVSAFSLLLGLSSLCQLGFATESSGLQNRAAWSPDKGDGTYKNPIIFADYSDPDVIRVGDGFYLVASSFNASPGLPVLHSRDLVNWTIIGHVFQQYPFESFNAPQHGNGVWAPSIRYQKGEFYVYFGDPDLGIFMSKTKNPAGPWEPLVHVKEAKGWIDTCPFWDDDGNAYLVHAWAKSRSGINSILTINRLSADGKKAGLIIFGMDYSFLAVEKTESGFRLIKIFCKNAISEEKETLESQTKLAGSTVFLRVKVTGGAVCQFSFSENGKTFVPAGERFTAREGRWVGAKVGLFALAASETRKTGYADFDWFRVE